MIRKCSLLFLKNTNMVISVHCEDEQMIRENLARHIEEYGDDIPMSLHPVIRSEDACYRSSSKAIELAKKQGARLHVFHLSTAKETTLFDAEKEVTKKKNYLRSLYPSPLVQ